MISAIAFVVILATGAVAIRQVEEGYHRYYRRDFKTAEPALVERVKQGDGFAAHMLGQITHFNRTGANEQEKSLDWYRKGAALGDIDSVVSYFWDKHKMEGPSEKLCNRFKQVVMAGARAGNLRAAGTGGHVHMVINCGPPEPITAAVLLAQAQRLDPRMGHFLEQILASLPPEEATRVEKKAAAPMAALTPGEFFKLAMPLLD